MLLYWLLLLLSYPSLLLFKFSSFIFIFLFIFLFLGSGFFCNCWQLNVTELLFLLWLYLNVVVILIYLFSFFWIVSSTNLYTVLTLATLLRNVKAILQRCYQGFDMLSPWHQGFIATLHHPGGHFKYSLYPTVHSKPTVEEGRCNACWEFLKNYLEHTVRLGCVPDSLHKLCPVCTSDISII